MSSTAQKKFFNGILFGMVIGFVGGLILRALMHGPAANLLPVLLMDVSAGVVFGNIAGFSGEPRGFGLGLCLGCGLLATPIVVPSLNIQTYLWITPIGGLIAAGTFPLFYRLGRSTRKVLGGN